MKRPANLLRGGGTMRSPARTPYPHREEAHPMPQTQLQIGPHTVQPPVVLAPLAGITNAPFRTLCREFSGGKGLFVSEMITTRALVERDAKTMRLIHFDSAEKPRSIQLYGV